MFDKSLAIVDVETTGMRAMQNRIIEIAVIKVEGSKIIDSFTSFVNPEVSIPSFITHITGISNNDVQDAPLFSQIKHKVKKILGGSIFVAHNVWFDYSFIQSEFQRAKSSYESERCCTVRLSRRLYPQFKSHSLANIIDRFGFKYTKRHRAYDDAFVVWQLLKKIKKEIPKALIKKSWDTIISI
jgi:DNA polymerase-3 subunit epsilon